MCFICGSEDHFIANFPKPETLDNKVHCNTENPKTCAYISKKIYKTSKNCTDEIDSYKIYVPMVRMSTNAESPRRDYGDSSQPTN